MNHKDIDIFAQAAQLGSFAAVAKARGTDPSSISRAIKALEATLGVTLFERSTRRLKLTEAGQLYLSRVVPLLEEIERLSRKARDVSTRPSGTLRLSAPHALGQSLLLPRLEMFRAEYPELRIDCLLTDAVADMHGERIDLSLRLSPAAAQDMISTPLVEGGMRAVASPGYLRAAAPITRPEDLASQSCILAPEAAFRARWLFRDRAGDAIAQPVTGPVAVSGLSGQLTAVQEGLGIALMPRWLVDGLIVDGHLQDVLPDWEADAARNDGAIWMVYPARDVLPYKVRAMMAFLRRVV